MVFDIILPVGATAILLVMGIYLVLEGLERRRFASQLRNTPTTPTPNISVNDDVVEVHGVIERHPSYDILDAPFEDGDCVYKDWEVWERRRSTGNSKSKTNWTKIAEGEDYIPFRVADGRGRVMVDPETFDTFLLDKYNDPESSSMSEDVQSFLKKQGVEIEENSGLLSRPRRFKQTLLKPNDEVYVYGKPEKADDEELDRHVITGFDDESKHKELISDYSLRRLHLQLVTGWLRVLYGISSILVAPLVGAFFFFSHPLLNVAVIIGGGLVVLALALTLFFYIAGSVKRYYHT